MHWIHCKSILVPFLSAKYFCFFSHPLNIHLIQVTGVNLDLACITIFVVCVFYTTAGERLFNCQFCSIVTDKLKPLWTVWTDTHNTKTTQEGWRPWCGPMSSSWFSSPSSPSSPSILHICHNHHNRWLCKNVQSSVKFSNGYVKETALILHKMCSFTKSV